MFLEAPFTVVVCFIATGVLVLACAPPEVGPADAGFQGPYPVAVDPPDGSVDVPTDKVFRVTFSEHLDARVVTSSRFRLHTGGITKWLMAYYNPVTKQAVVWPSGSMWPYSQWLFEIGEGLVGIDGEEVAPVMVTSFRTGGGGGDNQPYQVYDFDSQVKPLLEQRCGTCHSGPAENAIAGLSLNSGQNIEESTVYVESDGWPGWSRIFPSRPGESYLLYKVIGDESIQGMPMPRTLSDDQDAQPLSLEEQKLLADWIAGGAAFF